MNFGPCVYHTYVCNHTKLKFYKMASVCMGSDDVQECLEESSNCKQYTQINAVVCVLNLWSGEMYHSVIVL